MHGFDTTIPSSFLAAWAVLLVILLLWTAARLKRMVGTAYLATLLGLRLAAAMIVLLLLLQPFRQTTAPDENAFRVALLADTSYSMQVADCAGARARLDIVKNALAGNAGQGLLRQRLERSYQCRLFRFSDRLYTVGAGENLPLTPGRTALGDAVEQCVSEFSGVPLGAVLVLSDGRANGGKPVPETGKLCRALGIPVSCVGIGETRPQGDLSVHFDAPPATCAKGHPVSLRVVVRNTYPQPTHTRVKLSDGRAPLETRTVAVPGNGETPLSFSVTPWRAGFQTVTARLESSRKDDKPETDVDYLGLNVAEPDTFRCLYLGAHLNWEYKFLKLHVDASPQLELAAVMRTAANAFFTANLPDRDTEPGFPQQTHVLTPFDVIILDLRAANVLPAATIEGLLNFVEHRGGGLLCFGPVLDVPETMTALLPVLPGRLVQLKQDTRLDVNPAFIFRDDPGDILHAPGGLPLAAAQPAFAAAELKRGARAALNLRNTAQAALAAQSYGSGRVAYVGFENTWRWRLRSPHGHQVHDAFWNQLLVWLGSAGKQRLAPACMGRKTGIGEPLDLDLAVLGRDFRPATEATVACSVQAPSGERWEMTLSPSAQVPGRYAAVFFPQEAGEHSVRYRVSIAGENLEDETHFLAAHTGIEASETGYDEGVLRDLARITGGRFWHYRELDSITALPVSRNVPLKPEKRRWTQSGLLLALLAGLLGLEWYGRRRIGLK